MKRLGLVLCIAIGLTGCNEAVKYNDAFICGDTQMQGVRLGAVDGGHYHIWKSDGQEIQIPQASCIIIKGK